MFWLSLFKSPRAWVVLIVIVSVIITTIGNIRRSRRLRVFRERPDSLSIWQARFPAHCHADFTAFFKFFTQSFSLSSKYERVFTPDDRVMDIYRVKHPPGTAVDDLEMEALALDLKRCYRVELDLVWQNELTLGELFEFMQTQSTGQGSDRS